jgi:hypothetical protein
METTENESVQFCRLFEFMEIKVIPKKKPSVVSQARIDVFVPLVFCAMSIKNKFNLKIPCSLQVVRQLGKSL